MKNAILERVIKEISEHFEHYSHVFVPGSKVIDIGTGTGLAAHYLHKRGINVVGLDIIDYGNYRGPTLIIYDGIHIPFSDSEFDIALLLYVMRHTKNASRLLEETMRVARKVVIIEEFLANDVNVDCEKEVETEVEEALGLESCPPPEERTKEEFEKILSACNVRINKIKKLESKTKRRVDKYLYILIR